MEYRRNIQRDNESPRKRGRKRYRLSGPVKCFLVGITGIVSVVALMFGTSVFTNPEIEMISSDFVVSQHDKEQIIAYSENSRREPTETKENGGNSGAIKPASLDKIGKYSIDYYVMFPLYEGTLTQMNGDWDDDGEFEGNSDGGFGPVQETHSGLANTVDTMYDSNPEYFSWLKPYVDNPLLYMKSCRGNDHANHSWDQCRTYGEGTKILRAEIQKHLTTPEEIKSFYDAYMIVPEKDYLEPALQSLSSITGKPADELGPGTVATLFAINVRYGTKSEHTAMLDSSMTEDQIIEALNNYAVNRASAVDKPRFKCATSVAKAMNAGTIDIYGYYQCDGSCGREHGVASGRSFGELFGKE